MTPAKDVAPYGFTCLSAPSEVNKPPDPCREECGPGGNPDQPAIRNRAMATPNIVRAASQVGPPVAAHPVDHTDA